MKLIKQHKCFSGHTEFYQHDAKTTKTPMRFGIFLPPQREPQQKFPVLYWLSGLTCSEENFLLKAGAQKLASQLGIVIVAPDTSPRGAGVADEPQSYDLGVGAGFYLNATQSPWAEHYQMYDYIVHELPALIQQQFPVNNKRSISGHSMGGHGALTIALKNAHAYCCVSAFSPITNPSLVPWGTKAFTAYLGDDQQVWQEYDSCSLISKTSTQLPVLIDQGDNDEFIHTQLKPENLKQAAKLANFPIELRVQTGYDHSYFFIASFIDEHLEFHARYLTQ